MGMFDPDLSEFPRSWAVCWAVLSIAAALGTAEAGGLGASGQERGCPGLLVSKLVDHWPPSVAETLLPSLAQ